MHHDPRYFPNPEKFDPERWTPEAMAARPKFCYFPFGGGKRVCIGEAFAMTEGITVIAALARKWRLRRVSQEPVELEPGRGKEPAPLRAQWIARHDSGDAAPRFGNARKRPIERPG